MSKKLEKTVQKHAKTGKNVQKNECDNSVPVCVSALLCVSL